MPQDIVSQFDRKYALPIETYRQVNNITNRNNIPDDVRWEGMLVYVVSEAKTYYLGPGLEDGEWIDLGSIVNINIQNNLNSTMTTDALSAYMGKVLNETKLNNVTAGDNISIDYTDPLNPIIGSTGGIESVDWGDINGTLSNQSDLQSALDGKENTFFKNTAFNKNFGTTSGTVLQGNWRPSWGDVTGKPTTISGYGITDAYTKTYADASFLKNTTDTFTGNLTVTGTGNFGNSLRITGAFPVIVFDNETNDRLLYRQGNDLIFRYDGTNNGKMWNSGNDGAGSGLDADLLDGVQGSNYARTDIGTETFNGSLVANSFKTGNWEIDQTGTTLVFKYNGVAKFNMLSSGIIEATDHKNGLS